MLISGLGVLCHLWFNMAMAAETKSIRVYDDDHMELRLRAVRARKSVPEIIKELLK